MFLMLLLFAADPTGLVAGLKSADSVQVQYLSTNKTITLTDGEARELAALVEIDGKVQPCPGVLGTKEVYVLTIRKGESSMKYAYADNLLMFGGKDSPDKMVRFSDRRLGMALRKKFGVPELPNFPSRIPKITHTVEEYDHSDTDIAVTDDFVIVGGSELAVFRRAGDKLVLVDTVSDERFDGLRIAIKDDRVYVAGLLWLWVYQLDPDGKLIELQRLAGLKQANSLTLFVDHLYVTSRRDQLDVYSIDKDGELAHMQTVTHDQMKTPTGIAIHPEGTAAYVACYENTLLTFQRADDGKLTFVAADEDRHVKGGISPKDRGLSLVTAVVARNDRLYVLSRPGRVSVWTIGGQTPVFSSLHDSDGTGGGHRCTDLAFTSDRLWVASGDAFLLYFVLKEDGRIGGYGPHSMQGVVGVATRGEHVFAVGEKLWSLTPEK